MKVKLNKKKHWDCNNCKKISRVIFKNGIVFCFGLVKISNPRCDHYRYCIIKNNIRHANDLMKEEIETMLHGLSTTLLTYDIKEINKNGKPKR